MRATIRLVLLTALRDRLFPALFLLLMISTALSFFLGAAAISEQLQMAIVLAAGGGRLALILGLTIFAAFHIQSLFEAREIEAILSRAISRGRFVLSYWTALAVLALLVSGAFALVIATISGWGMGALVWSLSLVLECMIIMAVTVFAGLMMERATVTVLFTMGFYLLARLIGFFSGIRAVTDDTPFNNLVKHGLDIILLLVPRLDLFSQSKWLLYGAGLQDMLFAWAQSGVFLALLLVAATVDLGRKQF